MNAKRSKHPNKLDLQNMRNLILTMAVSTTIGFWVVFSRVDASQSADGGVPSDTPNEALFLESEEQILANLPPIPTLVPALDRSLAVLAPAGTAPASSTIASVLPTPSLIKPSKLGDPSAETAERTVKPRKTKDQSTSTRSS